MKFFFAGDVVLNDRTYSDRLVDSDLYEIITGQDIACCNLEGCIDKEELQPISKRGSNIKNGLLTLKRLKESGFNMVTLANNHIMDYGIEGLSHTIEALKPNFYYIGADKDATLIYRIQKVFVENMTIGFIAVAERGFGTSLEGRAGCVWMLDKNVWELLGRAREECDYFFVICHCGAEELIVPLPEVRELYRKFIDMGATAVIGHHPHVIQGWEEYKGKKIIYSLGNFAFDMKDRDTPYNPIGLCVCIEIKEGKISFYPIITEYKSGKIYINNENDDFQQANIILASEKQYKKYVDDYCVSAYRNEFRRYYAAISGLDISNKEKIYKFAYHRLNDDEMKWDDLFIYHNIAVETNRWICEHAIRTLGYVK